MEKKGEKRVVYLAAFFLLITILFLSLTSAGWLDWMKEITGKALSTFNLTVTVGVPQITTVYALPSLVLSEGLPKSFIFNFSVYSPGGAGNLNITSAQLNLTRSGEDTRQNLSCKLLDSGGDYANFTCNVTFWWWDGNGTWNIGARVQDNQSNVAYNTTQTQAISATTPAGPGMFAPTVLTWPGIAPGATNKTSNNHPLLINNTGNVPLVNISINSTNLRGETDNTKALWAKNYSVSYFTGGATCSGAACLECGGTGAVTMSNYTFVRVTTANLTKGNYSINDGNTGQEQLYFCLRIAGAASEISSQSYSTLNESAWQLSMVY